MEPKSTVSELQPETRSAEHQQGPCRVTDAWKEYLPSSFEPRRGQRATWTVAVECDPGFNGLLILPTGYGKTISAIGAYGILRARGVCNRMLVLVPNDQQREQWADQGENFVELGVNIVGITSVVKEPRELRASLIGEIEVFVATYQQSYNDPAFLRRLTSEGKWFVVVDECHHLALDQSWQRSLDNVHRCVTFYLSATPFRTDEKVLAGVPTRQIGPGRSVPIPCVEVSLRQALEEKAIRWPKAFAYEYKIGVTENGDNGVVHRIICVRDIATSEKELKSYEERKKLRFDKKYVDPMIMHAVNELGERNARNPGQHQMLVFAMNQAHAESITNSINDITGCYYADWIGVSRKETDEILKRFKDNNLRCLVHIDKAGEGFDNKRCSVGIFLHLIKSNPKIIQQIGRLMRRNYEIEPFESDTCQLYVGYDSSGVIDAIQKLEVELGESILSGKQDDDEGGGEDDRFIDIPETVITSVEYDYRDLIAHGEGEGHEANDVDQAAIVRAELKSRQVMIGPDVSDEMAAKILATMNGQTFQGNEDRAKKNNQLQIAGMEQTVLSATSRVASNAANMMHFSKEEKKAWKGLAMKTINIKWKQRSGMGHADMLACDFQRKLDWLRTVNEDMKQNKEVPWWLAEAR